MGKSQKNHIKTWWLVIALIVVLAGGVVFVGAVSGWFDSGKVVLDSEYYNNDAKYLELDAEEYKELIKTKKSFVVMVDQTGCDAANTMREYMTEYMSKYGIQVYKMMFEDLKQTTLYGDVRYYPSVVVISKGRVVGYLRADSDEDADKYNEYEALKQWLNGYLW